MSKQFEAVTIPKWGIEMTHGRIVEWRCAEGASVQAGDELVDIETDKIVNSFEARESGTLARILVAEGDELAVGTLIGVIALGGHSIADLDAFIAAQSLAPQQPPQKDSVESAGSTPDAEQPLASTDVKISPALLRKLAKAGISPKAVAGTGPNGRIVKEDVDRVLAKGADVATGAELTQALTGSQQKVARALSVAQSTVPIYHLRRQLSIGNALARLKEQCPSVSGGLTILLVKALARALLQHPELNRQFQEDGIRAVGRANVALAVAREDGAVAAPVLTDVDQSSVTDLSTQLTALIGRARAGRLVAEDSQGAAITLSNLGMYEIDDFTAMVTPPQVMVLSVGQLRMQPVWDDETEHFMPQQQVTMVLGSDHRVVNGAQAAQFLQTVAAEVETAWSGEL